MTVRLLVQCDGTPDDRPGMTLETCRAFLPVAPLYLPVSQTIDPDHSINFAYQAGWSQTPAGRDLCPACTRAATATTIRTRLEQTT